MLNKTEEKILRYLIKQKTMEFVDINLDKISLQEILDALESLQSQGYVYNASTYSQGKARITTKGKYYFDNKRKEKDEMIIKIENTNNQTVNQNLTISLENVYKGLENTSLTMEEQQELKSLLEELSKSKNKTKKWEKVKKVMAFLLDKTIEVGAAVLPFIASII